LLLAIVKNFLLIAVGRFWICAIGSNYRNWNSMKNFDITIYNYQLTLKAEQLFRDDE
jgi:hypothetical protein